MIEANRRHIFSLPYAQILDVRCETLPGSLRWSKKSQRWVQENRLSFRFRSLGRVVVFGRNMNSRDKEH